MKPLDVHIDPEFKASIPPSTAQENELLRANIIDEGFRDPIVAWKEKGILVDGHRRHAIWMEMAKAGGFFSTKPKLEVVERSFASREDAQNWIDSNQLTRRNLTPDQLALIRGRLYNRTKQSNGVRIPGKTAAKLAEQFAVSERTIRNDAAFASAVEALKTIEPSIEELVLSPGPSPTRQTIVEASQLAESKPEQALALLVPESEADEKPVRRDGKKSSLNTKRGLGWFFKAVRAAMRQALKAMPNASTDICKFFGELQAELTVETKEAA